MCLQQNKSISYRRLVLFVTVLIVPKLAVASEHLRITPNFTANNPVAPNARLELRLSRDELPAETHLAVFVGNTDVTALCILKDSKLIYTAGIIPLPVGETSVIVYLVSKDKKWTELARLPLLVEEPKTSASVNTPADSLKQPGPTRSDNSPRAQFIPAISVNVRAHSIALFFPQSSRPDRVNATDVAVQARFRGSYDSRAFSVQNEFDLAGSSVQREALRFADLGTAAMQLDLSSYSMRIRFERSVISLGRVSFGSSRHLINGFSSRGLSLTLPVGKRVDASFAAMNGSSIVGFNNFLGLQEHKHHVLGATVGFEVLRERPRGLRLEFGTVRGTRLPRSNFNQRNVNDAERSHGSSIRILGSDKAERFRFDGGFARSVFTNPADPLLYQGRDVVPVKPAARNARYLETTLDIVRGYELFAARPLNLTLAFRHEKIDPLYKSVAAFAQADRFSNEFDVNANVGDISFAANLSRANDNLAGIRSILKTLTRRQAFSLAFSTATLFSPGRAPSAWAPRLSYIYDRLHQFAAFVPVNGDFNSLEQIPNQVSINQTFAADWQFSNKVQVGYRFNHSFQDTRQTGRERGDVLSVLNGITLTLNPAKRFDVGLDINVERSSVFQEDTGNSSLRFGPIATWRINKNMTWSLNASTMGTGDRANLNHRRDVEFQTQYAWRVVANENDRWRKTQWQFFIRYANRYTRATDRLFGFGTFTKLQTFNAGLNVTFF